MTIVVFSKDRAMQLDAFLRSFYAHAHPIVDVHVLYKATSSRHELAYRSVFDKAEMHAQSEYFKRDVLGLLPYGGSVTFFVDDQIFMREWQVMDLHGLSLRLAPHLTRDYNAGDAPSAPPAFTRALEGVLSWRWRDGSLSWGYPLSVDGHVYDTTEMRWMLEKIDFHSPNTLEANLQAFVPRFLDREAFCYHLARVVNVPWNRVQTDWVNRCGSQHTNEDLLAQWEVGYRIDLTPFDGLMNDSVHQEFPLVLEARP